MSKTFVNISNAFDCSSFIDLAQKTFDDFEISSDFNTRSETLFFPIGFGFDSTTVFKNVLDEQIIIAICEYDVVDEVLAIERIDSIILNTNINLGALKIVMAQAQKSKATRIEKKSSLSPMEYRIQFGEYLEHAPTPAFITQDDLIVYLNWAGRIALKFHGNLPIPMDKFIHEDDIYMIPEYKAETEIEPNRIISYDIRFKNSDDEIIHGHITLSKIMYNGKLETMGTLIDITKRVKALNNLSISEDILKKSQILTNVGTFTVEIKNGKVWCSAQLKELLEVDKVDETEVKTIDVFGEIVDENDGHYFISSIKKAIENKSFTSTTFSRKTSSKVLKQYQLKCQPIQDGQLLLGTVQDISEYFMFEKRISKQQKITHEILNSFPFDVTIYNPDFTYQFVNEKAVPNEEERKLIIGKTDLEIFESNGRDITIATNRIKQLQNSIDYKCVVSFKETIVESNLKKVLLRAIVPIYEDNKLAQLIGTSIDLTKESQIKKNLEFRINFEQLLISLSNRLINISIDEIDTIIGEGLEQIGRLVGVDRAYIFKYSSNKKKVSNTHEWCADAIEPLIHELQHIPISEFTPLEKTLATGNIYKLDNAELLPDEANEERLGFYKEEIKSILIAPTIVSRKRVGFLGFHSIKGVHKWNNETVDMIKIAAEIISSAFERKATLKAILNSEEKFRTLSEKAHAAIFITRDSRYVYANPETCKLTGYSLDEILTKNITDVLAPEERKSATKNQRDIMRKDDYSTRNERRLITKTGEEKYIDITSNRIFYNGENAMISIAFDVTEKHKQEEERVALIDRLTMQNQDLEQFSYITSHNLRSPVAGIKGLTSIIDKNKLGNDLNKGIVERIEVAALRLDKVIQDLNEIISVKKTSTFYKQHVFFENLVDEFRESHSELINNAGAIIETNFTEVQKIYNVRVYINNILSNLLTNAIKYKRPAVPPRIEIYTNRTQKHIELIVKDNGLGIDLSKHRNKLFRFKQKLHLNVEGNGIGLYLVKTQAVAIGGWVTVESKVNQGSTFIVNIPA